MSYEIIETARTPSGKWQVRVIIDAETSQFFSFPSQPSQAQVDQEAEAWDLQRRLSILRSQPVQEYQPEGPGSTLSKLDYMGRFTDVELATIYSAAKTAVQIEVWLEKFKLSSDIDLKDPRTIAGVQALEAVGVLAPGRAVEILTV